MWWRNPILTFPLDTKRNNGKNLSALDDKFDRVLSSHRLKGSSSKSKLFFLFQNFHGACRVDFNSKTLISFSRKRLQRNTEQNYFCKVWNNNQQNENKFNGSKERSFLTGHQNHYKYSALDGIQVTALDFYAYLLAIFLKW